MGIYEKSTVSKILLLHRDHFKVLHAVNNNVKEQVLCVYKIKKTHVQFDIEKVCKKDITVCEILAFF